ncbi:MAG: M23 family metallopeptidase [Bacteroidia bacterium]|nr:M23 family metallopeptidase [Bacteroidia bacterium]
MARIKYTYNDKTCKYEPYYPSGRLYAKQVCMFFTLSFLVGLGAYAWYANQGMTLDEQMLLKRHQALKAEWELLGDRISHDDEMLQALVQKDDHNYRVILDSEPLPPSVRNAGVGGSDKLMMEDALAFPEIVSYYYKLLAIKHRAEVQSQSFDDLDALLDAKVEMWASRPAIQPMSNEDIYQLHLTYGSRFHPIFHIVKDHKGLDFSAAKGTPVYATGNGKVQMAYFSDSFGNVIYIDHGFGYETRYAHLSGFAIVPGQDVKRGQVIGYVGNTGTSVSSHLHYEVLFHNQHLNPINFFQRDLSNKEYERLIREGSQHLEPLD